MKIVPVIFVWQEVEVVNPDSGEVERRKAMVPQPRFGNVCGRQFHDGEEYPLVPLEARSRKSHSHYFAALHEGFMNLPEKIAARWPSEEHLRKWLLIETGWCDEHEFDMGSESNAKKLGKFLRMEDEYARISIHGTMAIIRRAKSQSAAAMGKQPFEESKKAVLELLEHLTSVGRGALMKNAGRSG